MCPLHFILLSKQLLEYKKNLFSPIMIANQLVARYIRPT